MPNNVKAIIHVGLHKTGTSALQSSLAANATSLADQGFLYPIFHGQANHSSLATTFLRSDHETARSVVDHIFAKARKTGAHTVILSSEVFSEHPIDMKQFEAIFSAFDVEIIAYLRRSDEIVISAYNELVRDNVSRWSTALSDRLPYDPTFHGVIGKWLDNPAWKFVIAPYDQPQWSGGTLLSDFLLMIGVDVTRINMRPMKNAVNKSLPPQLLEIVRLANALSLQKNERDNLIRTLYRISENAEFDNKQPEKYDTSFRKKYCERIIPYIPLYREYFREGFDERFLLPEAIYLNCI